MKIKTKGRTFKKVERDLENARSTLKVIRTWASFRGGSELIPDHVLKLCDKTLKETNPEIKVQQIVSKSLTF